LFITKVSLIVTFIPQLSAGIVFIVCTAAVSTPTGAQSHEHGHKHESGDEKMSSQSASNPAMDAARTVLDDATLLERKATKFIQDSNLIRKKVKTLRAQERGIEDPDHKAMQKETTDALAGQIEKWQSTSAELRDLSDRLKQVSMSLFIDGFSAQWRDWINNPAALSTDANSDNHTNAHNNQIRSAHPTMTELTPSTSEMPSKHEGMSIQVPELVSQPPADNLNTSSFQISRDQNFLAHIEVETTTQDEMAPVPMNEIHQWRLLISDLSGNAVEDATIEIVGHMPGHVHGLPTQPKVTQQIAPGVYRVDGVKFQMPGWWIIEFNIDANDVSDTVKFDLLL